jgi:hypothetical protein
MLIKLTPGCKFERDGRDADGCRRREGVRLFIIEPTGRRRRRDRKRTAERSTRRRRRRSDGNVFRRRRRRLHESGLGFRRRHAEVSNKERRWAPQTQYNDSVVMLSVTYKPSMLSVVSPDNAKTFSQSARGRTEQDHF